MAFAWRPGVDFEMTYVDSNVVNMLMYSDPLYNPWMLTFVYGPTLWKLKQKFWHTLSAIGNCFNGPWLCLGDFNSLLQASDKLGGKPIDPSYSKGLGHFMRKQGLIDLGFQGNPYTWVNGRSGNALIKERLDRGICNSAWRLFFPKASIINLPRLTSDHSPIIPVTTGTHSSLPKPFRFEAFWTRDSSSHQVISDAWQTTCRGSPLLKLCQIKSQTKEALKKWNKEHFGVILQKIQALTDELDHVQRTAHTEYDRIKESTLRKALHEELRREEML